MQRETLCLVSIPECLHTILTITDWNGVRPLITNINESLSHDDIFSLDISISLQGKIPGGLIEAPVKKADCGTQTDTHFMESNIVKTYEWNEWELRRKAIKLVIL